MLSSAVAEAVVASNMFIAGGPPGEEVGCKGWGASSRDRGRLCWDCQRVVSRMVFVHEGGLQARRWGAGGGVILLVEKVG